MDELVEKLENEDNHSSNNTILFYITDSKQNICCTARLLRKSEELPVLPVEEQCEMDLNFFEKKNIYEFARFASNKCVPFSVIAKMMGYMLAEIDTEDSCLFAAIVETLYKKFIRIKYPIYRLGKSVFYLGSNIVPVGIKLSELPEILEYSSK